MEASHSKEAESEDSSALRSNGTEKEQSEPSPNAAVQVLLWLSLSLCMFLVALDMVRLSNLLDSGLDWNAAAVTMCTEYYRNCNPNYHSTIPFR